MNRSLLCAAFAACMVVWAGSAYANLLSNGELTTPAGNHEAADSWSKSEPTLDGSNNPIDAFRFQKATFADWHDSTVPLSDNPGPDGDPLTNDLGGMWFRGFLGNNASNPGILVDASAWQDVAAGSGRYRLNFHEKHEFYFQAAEAGVKLEFYQGLSLLGSSPTFDLLATPGTNTNSALVEPWFARTLVGDAPAGTDTIRVLAFMEDGSDNQTVVTFKPQSLLLDGFELLAVPEPGSVVIALLGLVGLAAFRRQ